MNDSPLLERIQGPADYRNLPEEDLPGLAAEIRRELIRVVARTGGHLAPNLGVVELTMALLRVFDPERDVLVWDTGHQGYVYKLLTGRRDLFQSLRQDGGCCGFLHRRESRYDAFGAGHAGTAISAALGFAAARDRAGETARRVVAIVGDGALGSGVALEGLNNIIETTQDFLLVLNDNRMSIAPNVGALSKYLNRIIAGGGYNRFKQLFRRVVMRIPKVGPPLRQAIHRIEETAKSVLVPGRVFEELGLRYIGPLDGHDLPGLIRTLRTLRDLHEPLVVHVLTRKGKGYAPAEAAPEDFHGIRGSNTLVRSENPSGEVSAARTGGPVKAPDSAGETFSAVFGRAMLSCMERDERVVAITAGMGKGTGLALVRERFPERFYDVGIAEEHAVVFAAGLAAAGLRPVVAIYATFMQRAADYVFHDVCLQGLPVVFCLDRAGVVDDGPTHHGIQDLGIWNAFPDLAILQPADGPELEWMLEACLNRARPCMLRYPKAEAAPLKSEAAEPDRKAWGKARLLRPPGEAVIWALGRECRTALDAAALLDRRGLHIGVVNPRFVRPLDIALLERQVLEQSLPLVTLEDHGAAGGFGALLKERLSGETRRPPLTLCWPPEIIPWGTVPGLRRRYGLTPEAVAGKIQAYLNSGQSGSKD